MLSRVLSKREIELLDWAKAADDQIGEHIALFDMVMPNGKKLGDCTGRECAELGMELVSLGERIGTLVRMLSDALRQFGPRDR